MGITSGLEGCGWPVSAAGVQVHVYCMYTHVVGKDDKVCAQL